MVTNMATCLVVFVYVETTFDVPGWVILRTVPCVCLAAFPLLDLVTRVGDSLGYRLGESSV
jgi:hypothetical protein